jgi:phycoerythrin-associated linker protein
MDIHQFLQLFVGRWRSQRSNHQFGQENGGDARSEIIITELPSDSSEVVNLCQKYNFDPQAAISSMQLSWEEESLSSRKPKGSTLLVTIPDAGTSNSGVILSNVSKSSYEFADDESLTIKTAIADGAIEERVWYGNPNLRFRVATMIKGAASSDRLVQSSKFYSEIRIGIPQPQS